MINTTPYYKGEVGRDIRPDALGFDITGYTITLFIRQPSGTVLQRTGAIVDATTGQVKYTTIQSSELNAAGEFWVQAKAVSGSTTLYGKTENFYVEDTVETQTIPTTSSTAASYTLSSLKLDGATSGEITIIPAAVAGTWTWTLPTNDGDANQFLKTDGSGVTAWITPTLSTTYFAASTSAQLAAVLSDETGSGALVFGTSPTIVTPTIASFTNATHNHQNGAGGGTLVGASALSDYATAFVTSIIGTANQITASAGFGAITLSVPTSAQLSVAKLTNLTGNGFIKTSGGDGTLSIDTSTYVTSSVTTLSSLVSIGTITTGVWNGTLIAGTYGGTGVNNGAKTLTYLKNISFTAADDTGVYTLPTGTKTLLATNGSGTSLTGIPYTLTGTANQVVLSAGTGNITFSLPQDIGTASTPQFARTGYGAAADGTAQVNLAGAKIYGTSLPYWGFNSTSVPSFVSATADAAIHVSITSGSNKQAMLALSGRNTTNSNGFALISFSNNDGAGTDTENARIQVIPDGSLNADAGVINFYTRAHSGSLTTRMTIDNNGKVGINTTDPRNIFHVSNGATTGITATTTGIIVTGNSNSSPRLILENTGSTSGRKVFVLDSGAVNDGRFTISSRSDDGSSAVTSDIFSMSYAGNIYASNMASESGTKDAVCRDSSSKELLYNSGVSTCLVSSLRFKSRVDGVSSEEAWKIVDAMRPGVFVEYENPKDMRFGFAAEDVADFADARLVYYESAGQFKGSPRAVDYERYTAVLTKVVQDQRALIDALDARITTISAKLGI